LLIEAFKDLTTSVKSLQEEIRKQVGIVIYSKYLSIEAVGFNMEQDYNICICYFSAKHAAFKEKEERLVG
jgi:hypothetical protein